MVCAFFFTYHHAKEKNLYFMPLIKPSSYEKRLQVWNDSRQAVETHIKLAQVIINNGVKLFKELENSKDSTCNSDDDSVTILQKATACIEKGIKIETQARKELTLLYNEVPKE